jgi:hypothetical protein
MAANIVELEAQLEARSNRGCLEGSDEAWVELPETYEAFRGDIGRRKTTRRLVRVNDEP